MYLSLAFTLCGKIEVCVESMTIAILEKWGEVNGLGALLKQKLVNETP